MPPTKRPDTHLPPARTDFPPREEAGPEIKNDQPTANTDTTEPDLLATFDPNGIGAANGNLYGLPFSPDTAELVIVPVTWEVTVSYGAGTARAPEAVLAASPQLDLYDADYPNAWRRGIAMLPIDPDRLAHNDRLRTDAAQYIQFLEQGGEIDQNETMRQICAHINQACAQLNADLKQQTLNLLKQGKKVGLLGGDHSSPLGFMEAIGEHYGKFGILQIDAHADLRNAYEGFTYSHASIMYNALQLPCVTHLVSVGVRDACDAEIDLMRKHEKKTRAYYDHQIQRKVQLTRRYSWAEYCQKIIKKLPKQVYLSFDIDGLDPKLCPNTGTPVAGGLSFAEAAYLLRTLARSGKTIVGFDLCEVGIAQDTDWDANVGARILYKLCGALLATQKTKNP